MEKEIIKKEVSVIDDVVIVVEETKSTMTKYQLEKQLSGIKDMKFRLQEQNKRIVTEFKGLEEEEVKIKNLIEQLSVANDDVEEI